MIGLALLVAATGFAVGATTTFWLVPVYLLVMGWLLAGFPSAKASSLPAASPANDSESPVPQESSCSSDEVASSPAEPPAKRASKPRTRGTRSPKAKAKAKPEPEAPRSMATWVQVAPGKFVRVEVPQTLEGSEAEPASPDREAPPLLDVQETSPEESTNGDESELVEEAEIPVETAIAETSENLDFASAAHQDALATSVVTDEIANPPVPADQTTHTSIVEPRPSRIVAKLRGNAFGVLRSSRVKSDPRALLRRPSGRVGAIPRVMLHRS